MHYRPRPCDLRRSWIEAIELTIYSLRHEIIVYYPTNVKISLLNARKLSIYILRQLALEHAIVKITAQGPVVQN